jgi:hypothetical protein
MIEQHLRRILTLYSHYYNETRTHLGLECIGMRTTSAWPRRLGPLSRRRRSPITHGSALVAFERSKLALAPLIRSCLVRLEAVTQRTRRLVVVERTSFADHRL